MPSYRRQIAAAVSGLLALFLLIFLLAFSGIRQISQQEKSVPENAARVSPDDTIVPLPHSLTGSPEVPPMPRSLADAIHPYKDYHNTGFMNWHPTRREMLIREGKDLYSFNCEKSEKKKLTSLPHGSIERATYDPIRSSFIVYNEKATGKEDYQNYRLDLATQKVTRLTPDNIDSEPGFWSHSGRLRAYISTRRYDRYQWYPDIYIVDPRHPESDKPLLPLPKHWDLYAWTRDDLALLLTQDCGDNRIRFWRLEVSTKKLTPLTPPIRSRQSGYGAGYSIDSEERGIYIATDQDSHFFRLRYFDFASCTFSSPLDRCPDSDISTLRTSEEGAYIFYVSDHEGAINLHVRSLKTGEDRTPPGLPPVMLGRIAWRPHHHELGFTATTYATALDIYTWNLDTNKLTRLTNSTANWIPHEPVAVPTRIAWKGNDGTPFSGYLYQPSPRLFPGPRPVVIDFHGGPKAEANPDFLERNEYLLNRLGVAMLFPNIRGSTGHGPEFAALDDGVKREGAYRDVGVILDWIKTRPSLDSKRVMVQGTSYGGHIGFIAATRYADRVACVSAFMGPSSLYTMQRNTDQKYRS